MFSNEPRAALVLDNAELSILTGWTEALAEALAFEPKGVDEVLTSARSGASWRPALGIPEPSSRLNRAIDLLGESVRAAETPDGDSTFDELLRFVRDGHANEDPLTRLVRRVLRSTLEHRRLLHLKESASFR
jgi:hypothetical protein